MRNTQIISMCPLFCSINSAKDVEKIYMTMIQEGDGNGVILEQS